MTPSTAPPRGRAARHPVDHVLPLPRLAAYGIQHVLAFHAGAVIVWVVRRAVTPLS
jgi:uric acid transporter